MTTTTTRTRRDALVDADWLEQHLADDDLRIVEMDVSPDAHAEGHIPGAVLWNIYIAIILGVAIAGLLGYGAALVTTGHLPWIGHQVTSPVAAEATAGARSGAVSSGVVDPFEAQFATVAAQAAIGVVGGTSLEAVTHSALDPFELRSTSPGSSSVAVSVGNLAHGALDPFELRSASVAIETGSGSIVPQSALDPFELRSDTGPATDTASPTTPLSGREYPRPAFE